MGYVIAAVVVLLIVAGLITFLVLNSMRTGSGTRSADPSADDAGRGGPPGIGEDPTPLGDTSEHAGEQSEHGTTEDDPESPDRGLDPAGDASRSGDDGPRRPARPEDRQLRDAGADSGPATDRPRERSSGESGAMEHAAGIPTPQPPVPGPDPAPPAPTPEPGPLPPDPNPRPI